MTPDPLDLARAALDDAAKTFTGDQVHEDALARVLAYSTLALAEALTLPQGAVDTGQTTGFVAPAPSPAEPALVALDLADEATHALIEWRKVDRIYPPEEPAAWPALARLRDVADRIELAR